MALVIPILRIFDYYKAIEFYIDWLGFKIEWEHRFSPGAPVYMEISLGDVILRLSEHHGDGSPGIQVFIKAFDGLVEYHKVLTDKKYKYYRPGLEIPFWDENALSMDVTDPFGNRLFFVNL